MSASDDRLADLHYNGVHVECTPRGSRKAGDTHRACKHAGKVESLHGHSFEGPLVCGCEDFAVLPS